MARCDVLVTGARGFVGGHVLYRARAAGLDAVAADGDLRDATHVDAVVAAAHPRAVVHLAATRRGGPPWPALLDDLAMAGAVAAAVARHAPDAPLLIAGSAAQYGVGLPRAVTEQDSTVPMSTYGAVKSIVEQAVLTPPLGGGLRIIAARSFNHVGPGQGPEAPAAQWAREIVAAEAKGGGTIRTGELGVVRDFLDVRDVADAYLALVHSPAEGIVNVCSGVPTPLRRVLDALVEAAAVPITVERDPALIREHDPPHVVGDPGRLRALTGWSPRIALEQSLADQLAELRAAQAQAQPDVEALKL
jgi:GDP-4-dehydro-6-deoxy-D-mannose reductase